jgi:hypothetical protein
MNITTNVFSLYRSTSNWLASSTAKVGIPLLGDLIGWIEIRSQLMARNPAGRFDHQDSFCWNAAGCAHALNGLWGTAKCSCQG